MDELHGKSDVTVSENTLSHPERNPTSTCHLPEERSVTLRVVTLGVVEGLFGTGVHIKGNLWTHAIVASSCRLPFFAHAC
jgi:hypothetical protein